MEEADDYEDGHEVELDHDEDKLVSKYTEHLQERDDNEEMISTAANTEHQIEDEDDSEELSVKETDRDLMNSEEENDEFSLKERDAYEMEDVEEPGEMSSKERDVDLKEDEEEEEEVEELSSNEKDAHKIEDDEDLSLKGTDTYRMEDGEEMLTTEFDSDLNKSDSLPSLADSEEQSDSPKETNDVSGNHTAQYTNQYTKPSIKKERHIADALPNDIDLLADYESETSEAPDATKLTWSAFKIAYLISAPLTVVGLALVVMGALNIPETFNLLTVGVPVFVIALLVFVGSTLYLCFYKAKKMRLFEFGEDVEGEIAGVGNMAYAQEEETTPPKVTYDDDEQTPL